ncbi:hypothetical protein [Marinomonas mediterranea]|jgi:hypothetical protein|uniref:Immunity protein 40 domain-containing protein n=2 Tax=Marinomonas mediterranea TaxID=119864 RepID=F2K386_MARM1|nr:hypothetical protein [Marinomonas mediterranea]ADZ90139.1 hypothetical protein Marme_0864 [Marinomonas mediterranea MMB-1]WCN16343.1 hypothetical protein GV053_04375 [Marinomonas mediterranea MMB-1]
MTEADLISLFNDKGVFCGSEFIVNRAYCGDFLQASKSAGFAVIGIEGFYLLKDGSLKPNLDEIADFSDIEDVNNFGEYIEACFKAANRFVVNMNSNGESDGYCFTLTDLES